MSRTDKNRSRLPKILHKHANIAQALLPPSAAAVFMPASWQRLPQEHGFSSAYTFRQESDVFASKE